MKHAPVSKEYVAMMNAIAETLDEAMNGKVRPRKIGFALLVYNLGEDIAGTGRVNYIGNGERSGVLTALKELVARWEGRYSETETTQ